MAAVMDTLVENRGLKQLYGGTHRDESLAVFLQRQSHAFFVAASDECIDERAIVGDANEIVPGANLDKSMDYGANVYRLARRRLQQAGIAPSPIVATLLAIAIEQTFLGQPEKRQHGAAMRPIQHQR